MYTLFCVSQNLEFEKFYLKNIIFNNFKIKIYNK